MKKKEWLILGIITVVAGLALGCTDLLTRDSIADQANQALNAARIAVMPDASEFAEEVLAEGATLDSLHRASADGEPVGYVGQTTVSGFGGPIVVVLGVDDAGTVTGINVGGSNFAETAGLGTKAREPEFTDQFTGLTSAPQLKENVDAIAGATVTSSAVTTGANNIYQYIMATLTGGEVPVAEEAIAITVDDRRVVAVQGFAGEIEVTVGVNADGSIEAIEVGGANFQETAGLGALAQEPAFTNQFAGKTAPLSLGVDVDALAGATITSNAVVNAVNQAMGVAGSEASEPAEEVPDETNAATDSAMDGAASVVTKSAEGFGGEIEVTVGLNEDGSIAAISVGGANFNETAGFGAKAQEPAFTDQFVGKSGTLSYGDGLDAIAGATITSNAVLDAVNEALGESAGGDEPETAAATESAAVSDEATVEPEETAIAPATATSVTAPAASGAIKTTLKTVQGFAGEIEVIISQNEDGSIAAISVGGANFNETAGFGAKAQEPAFTDQFVGKSGALSYGDGLDAIAGATITSNAVLDAVNEALGESAGSGEPETAAATENAAVSEEATAEPESTAVAPATATAVTAPVASGVTKTILKTVQGFAGEIDVIVSINADGSIAGVTVGGANFNETAGFGAKAQDPAFTDQFVGKSGTLSYGDGLDAIAGATITSNAVLDAVNQALAD